MKRRELKAIAGEYARAVCRARELESKKRELIDKCVEQAERKLEEAKRLTEANLQEQMLSNKNEVDELDKLVNELVKGE